MRDIAGKRIVLCFPVEDHHIEQIQSTVPSAKVEAAGQQEIDSAILQADIFCGHAKEKPVPWPEVVDQGKLVWIQSSAAGLDHCLSPEVIASTIQVTSASGLFADQVAEQTMALLFGLIRSSRTFFEQQRSRAFIRRPTFDLHGKTVGIVGFGGNGRRIAEVLSTMKVRLVATDLFPVNKPKYVDELWDAKQLPRLLACSDVVILCVPLNDDTFHMMGETQFSQMNRDAIFVNVARGAAVDESALVSALNAGIIGAAGLDVTEIEPLPTSSLLWEMKNVVITPHVGAQSADRVDVTVNLFCENLQRFQSGETLFNLVDKQLGFPKPEHRWV